MANDTNNNDPAGTIITHDFWQTVTPITKIGRRLGQFTIPAVGTLNVQNAIGVPSIVTKFNFTAENNFTIKLQSIPALGTYQFSPNYNLCIRYTNPITNKVYRYKLWPISSNPTIDVAADLYIGQPILGANFSVEVWSIGAATSVTLSQPLTLTSSITKHRVSLTDCDTFDFGGTPLMCNALGNIPSFSSAPDLTNNIFWFDPLVNVSLSGTNVTAWASRNGTISLAAGGTNPTQAAQEDDISFVGAATLGSNVSNILPNTQYFIIRPVTAEASKFLMSFVYGLTYGLSWYTPSPPNTLFIFPTTGGLLSEGADLTLNTWYLIEVTTNRVFNVFNLLTGALVWSYTPTGGNSQAITNITLGDNTATTSAFKMREWLGYSAIQSSAQRLQTLEYLFNLYQLPASFNLPLTYAPCAVS